MRLVPEPDFPELQRHPSGIWYVRKYVTGKGELLRSTREKRSKSKAKAIALKILSDWMGKSFRGRTWTFEEVAAEVTELKAAKSPATQYSAYNTFKKHLCPFFGDYRIDQIDETIWERYVVERLTRDPDIRLFNHWKHFIMVMRHANRKGLTPRPLTVKNPDRHESPGKVFSDDEIRRLMANANPELKIQILMATTMGMRKGEILGLTWDRVDFDKNTIHLRAEDTKTRTSRTMGMSPQVRSNLEGKARVSAYVFQWREDKNQRVRSNKFSWTNCRTLARVDGRFHDLRHTFLTKVLMDHKANPLSVSVFAGVSLREIQDTYLHPSVDSTRDISKMIRVKSGKRVRKSHD